MDAADLIDSFGKPYTVTRRASNGTDRGRALPTTNSTIPIIAAVQPATGRDLDQLPELQRSHESKVVFTITQLMIAEEGGAFLSDVISIDGRDWQIQHLETWKSSIEESNYFRAIVQAVK